MKKSPSQSASRSAVDNQNNAVMVTFGKRHAKVREKFNMLQAETDESASGFAVELIKESLERRIKRTK